MKKSLRVTMLAALAAAALLAAGCAEISIFSSRHYHYHGKCGPACRAGGQCPHRNCPMPPGTDHAN